MYAERTADRRTAMVRPITIRRGDLKVAISLDEARVLVGRLSRLLIELTMGHGRSPSPGSGEAP